MPLYMDIHKFDEIVKIDDVKKAHELDKTIQDEYNVKYHQFWVNRQAGMVFCLVEGPSKEACELVHKNTHGFVACNIVEVEPGNFKLFMGDGLPVDHGLVYDATGSVDPGYRHILLVDIQPITSVERSEDYKKMRLPISAKNILLDRIAQFNGRVVENLTDDNTVGVFNTAVNAIRCTKEMQNELLDRMKSNAGNEEWNISFRIGLVTAHPLTENSGFFSQALSLARRLCLCAKENEALVSSLMAETTNLEDVAPLKPLSRMEESFINDLFSYTESNMSSNHFNVDNLSHALSISRPQLYRKIMSLTGRTPIDFISALRMSKALSLMKNSFGNVSQVALEVGYSNPSYFSKCFQKNYGCTPSEFIKNLATP